MRNRPYLHRLIAAGLLALALVLPATRPAPARAAGGFRPGELVAQLNPARGATIEQINATYGTRTLAQLAPGSPTYLLAAPAGSDALLVAEQLDLDARLEFAEPNYLGQSPEAIGRNIKAFAGFDPAPYGTQYAGALLGLSRAQALSSGAGTVVAVIDTGVHAHAQLQDRLVAGYDFLDGDASADDQPNGLDDDGDGLVDEAAGHGTHVAGIVHLVAPDAQIMPLRVLDSDGAGDIFLVARAIDYAIGHGAHVINLSLGTPDSTQLLKKAVRAATHQGILVVAGAGNSNSAEPSYPAATNCALAVSATDAADHRASFASYGSWVDLTAPGVSIYSSVAPDGYAWWSGTSMAAPFVAGQAALIRAGWPAMSLNNLVIAITATAQPLGDSDPAYAGRLGYGRVSVGASLAALAAGRSFADAKSPLAGSCTE